MGYVNDDVHTLIDMMYGHDEDIRLYHDMLDSFGKAVEDKVLPAEKKTNELRAIPGHELLAARLKQNENLSQETLEAAVADISLGLILPEHILRLPADLGLPSVPFSEVLGGMGFPFAIYNAMLETLGKASSSLGVTYAISNTATECLRFNVSSLSGYGKDILSKLVSGEMLAAFALTEGEVSGSNILRELTTTAKKDGDKYILNGKKMFITNLGIADVYTVFARTQDGISLFLVEDGTPGFSMHKAPKRTVQNSPFGELVFENVEIPKDNIIGVEGEAGKYAMQALNSGRVTIAALATGLAQRAFDEYMSTAISGKPVDGKQLIEYQAVKDTIGAMLPELHASRALTYMAAWHKNRLDYDPWNKRYRDEYVIATNSAKLKASLTAQEIAMNTIKIRGGGAVLKEDLTMVIFEDTWLHYFGEAVPEVLRRTVADFTAKRYS